MCLRGGKFVSMSRPLGNSSPQGVPPPQYNSLHVEEEQPIGMVDGTGNSTTIGVTAPIVSQL